MNVSLASNLLKLELDAERVASEAGGTVWKTGIDVLDRGLPDGLWSGGRVIGVGVGAGVGIVESGRMLKNNPSIPLEIIVTHLLSTGTTASVRVENSEGNQPSSPSVFIISPPTAATNTIQRVYSLLSSRNSIQKSKPPGTSQPPADAKTLLNQVSLLQYLDVAGLLESLSEVSSALQSCNKRSILLIQGLTSAFAATQRKNGLVQTAALLTSVLHSISSLSRSTGGIGLCLLELEIVWVVSTAQAQGLPQGQGVQQPHGESSAAPRSKSAEGIGELQTAFSSNAARVMKVNAHVVLGELIARAIDTIVVVHDADGKVEGKARIVEVVKDEKIDLVGDAEDDDDNRQEDAEDNGSALGRFVMWK